MGYSKYILMLGAGLMQKPAIDGAHELGYHVTVTDGNADALCAPLADRFEHIDLKDTNALNALAKTMKQNGRLDGVFTAGTDFSAVVAEIAKNNNLSGHGFDAALNATDKIRMRTCFQKAGVASPHFTFADSAVVTEMKSRLLHGSSRAKEFLPLESDFPLVVKPCDNMGARGCRMCVTAEELISACEVAVRFSRTGRAIIEEYMDGGEYSIDSLVYDGKIVITGFADRHIYFPPYFIEMGHTMSTDLSKDDRCRVAQTFAKGVRALGLTHGAAKGDMKLTSKGAMVGEIAARLSGGYMSGWTFPYASGINLTKEALRLAVGEKPDLFGDESLKNMEQLGEGIWYVTPRRFSAERAWISIPGTIQTVYGLDNAKETSGIKDVLPRVMAGDSVTFPVNNVEKCGNCISLADTREEAVTDAENAVSEITIRLKCPNPATEAFLNAENFLLNGGSFAARDAFGEHAHAGARDASSDNDASCKNGASAAHDALSAPDASELKDASAAHDALSAPDASVLKDASAIHDAFTLPPTVREELSLIPPTAKYLGSAPWKTQLPPVLAPYTNERDYNHKTLAVVLEQFASLCPTAIVSARTFWLYLIRASLQGILYAADSALRSEA